MQRRLVATLEVPQIQFIAGVSGHSSSQQRWALGFQQWRLWLRSRGFSAFLGQCSRSSRLSGVERQFLEPLMVKSSLPSRAPAQFILSVC